MELTPAARRWSAVIDEQEASGESIRAFARARGLNPSTLSWWRSRLGRTSGRPAPFVELVLQEPSAPVVMQFPDLGLHVSVEPDTDLDLLRRVLDLLC